MTAALGVGCECVSQHSPHSYVPNRHHKVPKSWGGLTVDDNIVTLCNNGHASVHALLDDYVRANGDPGWDLRQHFSPFIRDLALRAWEQRPAKPTITSRLEPQ